MSRFHNRNFELLEPYDAKVSCTVLRGESIRKDADLLDILEITVCITFGNVFCCRHSTYT